MPTTQTQDVGGKKTHTHTHTLDLNQLHCILCSGVGRQTNLTNSIRHLDNGHQTCTFRNICTNLALVMHLQCYKMSLHTFSNKKLKTFYSQPFLGCESFLKSGVILLIIQLCTNESLGQCYKNCQTKQKCYTCAFSFVHHYLLNVFLIVILNKITSFFVNS